MFFFPISDTAACDIIAETQKLIQCFGGYCIIGFQIKVQIQYPRGILVLGCRQEMLRLPNAAEHAEHLVAT